MVRSILACVAVALTCLAQVAYSQTWEEFELDPQVLNTFAGPVSALAHPTGTLASMKDFCAEWPICIGVIFGE